MAVRDFYRPRYKVAFQAKSKIWPYKNSRLRRFFNIRGRKLVRRGLFKRIVLVFNNMKWTVARRYIRPFMKKRRPIKRRFKTAFYSKQQLRAFYGKEKEEVFRNFFKSFAGGVRNRGRVFISGIEARADIFLYRLRFLPTIYACRQFIYYFGVRINRGLEYAPSTRVLPGDIITFRKLYWSFFLESLEERIAWRVVGNYLWKRRERKKLRKKLWRIKRNHVFKKKNLALLTKRRYVFRIFLSKIPVFFNFYTNFKNSLRWTERTLLRNFNAVIVNSELATDSKVRSKFNVWVKESLLRHQGKKEDLIKQNIIDNIKESDKNLYVAYPKNSRTFYKDNLPANLFYPQGIVPYFDIDSTLKELEKNTITMKDLANVNEKKMKELLINFRTVLNWSYGEHEPHNIRKIRTVADRLDEIQKFEIKKYFWFLCLTQIIKQKLTNLWYDFKAKLSRILIPFKKEKRFRLGQDVKYAVRYLWKRRVLKFKGKIRIKRPIKSARLIRRRKRRLKDTRVLYMRRFLSFINWIFKAYKFLYYSQAQFKLVEESYLSQFTWILIRPIYEKKELLLRVVFRVIEEYERKRKDYEKALILNTNNNIRLVSLSDDIVKLEAIIFYWKLIAKNLCVELFEIGDYFSKRKFALKKKIISRSKYKQVLESIKVLRARLLINRIKRFMRKPRIVKDRFTKKPKKLRSPLLFIRTKRRYKARRRKTVLRFRRVHWHIPRYIYLDPHTLRAVYLYHPKPEEVTFAFRCSLKALQAFYSGAGY
jgi:ribosomal protein S4